MDRRTNEGARKILDLFAKRRNRIRVFAWLLLLSMLVSLAPMRAEAAQSAVSEANSFVLPLRGTKVSSGRQVKNTYLLEVSSGTRFGGGTAENIVYFMVSYTTGSAKRTMVLMPQADAISTGFKMAAAVGSRQKRIDDMTNVFGYKGVDLYADKAMGSVQTDQFMFTTPEEITSIDRIQIFGSRTDTDSSWACQGLRIFKVDTLYGLDMVGYYSSKGYIDFDGTIVAEACMIDGSGVFYWNTSGGMYNIGPLGYEYGTAGIALVTPSTKQAYEAYSRTQTHVGMQHVSQVDNMILLRLDLADEGGGGFEALAAYYESGAKRPLSDMSLCECASLTVRYLDIYDCVRDVKVPLMMCALGYIYDTLGDVAIAGYGQQGDSIAVPLMLPDYTETISVSITLGEAQARAEIGLETDASAAANGVRNKRLAASAEDGISYITFVIYEDVNVTATLDGATIRYKYEPGKNNPIQYTTSSTRDGIALEAKSNTMFSLQEYGEGSVLEPGDRQERYLVTLCTDNIGNAGTISDIKLQFKYISMKDKELVSDEFKVRDYVRKFYGEWAGNVSDFAYCYGLRQGGTVQFIIPLSGVKEFTEVSIKLDGGDEWQMSGLSVAYVKKYEQRVAAWEEIASVERDPYNTANPRYLSHLRYTRRVTTDPVCFTFGSVYGEEGSERITGEIIPGTLVQDDGKWKTVDGNGTKVAEKDDVDWETLSLSMSYEDALQDLGFTRERAVYRVSVEVAGDKTNVEDDDCGSANLFYFQLLFEKGSSGVALANQQIVGDAFRTGTTCFFDIPMSQTYGDLVAIQVIPDNQDDNGNIYDKLKIKSITVELKTEDAISPVWRVKGDEKDGLGWVGIDYVDPGEAGSMIGTEGHTVNELATTYQVTETSFSAKLLITIETGPYGNKILYDENLQQITAADNVFCGGLSMSFNYYNTEGRLKNQSGIDVIGAMEEYAGRTGTKIRTVQVGDEIVTEAVDFYVSDPAYQFRPGKRDSFIITVDDITQIIDMKLQIRSSVVTQWNISSVKVYQVMGTGTRVLNQNGEYSYRYPTGEEPVLICNWTRKDEGLKKDVQVYRKLQNNSIGEVNIVFEENKIILDGNTKNAKQVLPKEPVSKNDILNLYIYPSEGAGFANPTTYDLTAAIRYTDATNMRPMQTSTGKLQLWTDENGQKVFYALGVSANNMDGLDGVDVKTTSLVPITAPITYGIVQRIRGGVLIETYILNGCGNADLGGTLTINTAAKINSIQRLFVQVGTSVKQQDITAEVNDLAAAVYFKTISGQEFRSKYVYLSDMGVTQINPGQMLEFDFNLGDGCEVTGVNLVTIGNISMTADNMFIANQKADGTILGTWSVQGSTTPTFTPSRMSLRGDVNVLRITTVTSADEASMSSGTKGPIRMMIGYYDQYDVLQTKTYNDIRPYVQEGGFGAGETAVIEILIPGLREARWIDIEPWHETTSSTTNDTAVSSWKIYSLTAKTGLDGLALTRVLDKRAFEKDPMRVFLADVIMSATVYTTNTSGSATETKIHNGEDQTVIIASGAQVRIVTKLSGSSKGYEATLSMVNLDSGQEEPADLDSTSKYDADYIDQLYQLALASASSTSASSAEKEAAKNLLQIVTQIQGSAGKFVINGDTTILLPPRNYTNNRMRYRIKIASKENPDAFFSVDVIIPSESVDLEGALSAWNATRAAGTVTVNGTGETYSAKAGEEIRVLVASGGSITITPAAGSESFTASVKSYDPYSGATGQANLNPTHGYSDEVLAQIKSKAQQVLYASDATEEEKTAAQKVLDTIANVDAAGQLTSNSSTVSFTVPRNFTGSTMYYMVTVTSASNKELVRVIVSINSETNPLPEAVSQLDTAISNGDAQRAQNSQSDQNSEQGQQQGQQQQDSDQSSEESSDEEPMNSESSEGSEDSGEGTGENTEGDGNNG